MMMESSRVKYSGGKIPSHSDLRVEGAREDIIIRKVNALIIGTWNVRTLNICGKLDNLKIEMNRMQIDILGISEMRWPDAGDFSTDEFRIIHSGANNGQAGVAIVLRGNIRYSVKEVVQVNERLILVKIASKPKDTVLIQVYMPTSAYEDEEVETVYDEINKLLERVKGDENLIIMGDWNAVVGEGEDGKIVGHFGLGTRNDRGNRLIEFCEENRLVIANTLFKHHVRRRYTWRMPGDRDRFQIDYILVKQRFRNQVQNCRSYPGADIDSDHNLVLMKSRLRFKKVAFKISKKWDVEKLKDLEVQDKFERGIAQNINQISGDVNQKWEGMKECLKEVADKELGTRKKLAKKSWITDEIVEMITKRRELKNKKDETSQAEYRRLRNKINRDCKVAREKMIEEQCVTIEDNFNKGNVDFAYRLIKQNFEERRKHSQNIKSKDGVLLTDDKEIAGRWKEYLEDLYTGDELRDLELEDQFDLESRREIITRQEFDKTLKDLKRSKAAGIDEIPAELLKAAGIEMHDRLFELVTEIYNTGVMPKDFEKNIIIPIGKKLGAIKCEEFRTLCLTTHAAKILCRIVKNRVEAIAETFLGKDQFGFRRDRGTREPILTLKLILEKRLQKGKNTYLTFIDLEKAFDRVNWSKMFEILKRIGISYRDRRVIHSIYKNQSVVIKVGNSEKEAKIRKGVRQGCSLSPVLFNIYIEDAINKIREQSQIGVTVGNERIDMLRYADDMAVISETKTDLEKFLKTMDEVFREQYDMKINTGKTKTMISRINSNSRSNRIKIGDTVLDQVEEFCYLGSYISQDGRSVRDIKARIAQARRAFMKKKKLLSSRSINLGIRKKFLKTYVWSVVLYGSEAWTIGEADKKKLESFETWCYRRMLGIGWMDRITNVEVYRRIEESPCFWKRLKIRRDKFIGHRLRHEGMLQEVLKGAVQGKNRKGRPRFRYEDQIVRDVACSSLDEMINLAQDRDGWRAASNRP